MYSVTYQRYDEQIVPGKRLGRHVRRDSRSLAYPYRPARTVPIVSVLHTRHIPILDQLDVGSCTGNAEVGALATDPIYGALPKTHAKLNEAEAVRLYGAATAIDGYPGTYPPTDTGSDGTAVSQAALNSGYISAYAHAATVDDVLQALMTGPVLLGIDWYGSFDNPDSDGNVMIAAGASVRGGHEIVARGVDSTRQLIHMDNSWGSSWGNQGCFSFTYATFHTLLSGNGDAVVPLPLSVPAPEPVPVPDPVAPDEADRTLAAATADWARARHVTSNKAAALAVTRWAQAKGLWF